MSTKGRCTPRKHSPQQALDKRPAGDRARGYGKFLQDFLRPQSVLLDAPTRQLFFAEQRTTSRKVLPTTLGWHRGQLGGAAYYSKPGGGPGFSSNVRLYPERGIATVWLSNKMRVTENEIQKFSDTLDRQLLSLN